LNSSDTAKSGSAALCSPKVRRRKRDKGAFKIAPVVAWSGDHAITRGSTKSELTIVQGETGRVGLRTNHVRRGLGIVICFAPVVLLLASLGVGLAYPQQSGIGIGLALIASLFAGLNCYLSFVRPLVYSCRHGSTNGMRNISGLPGLGTFFVVASGIIGFADWRSAAVGLAALFFDTGGLPWFLLVTWRDRSLWDAEHS
jgi:hypothetical protein